MSDYSCIYLKDGVPRDCTLPQNHQGGHRRPDGLLIAPGYDKLWGLFGLSYAGFFVLSEKAQADAPAKMVARLHELKAEMPRYLSYWQPRWSARAVDENGRFVRNEWGSDHLVMCRAAMHSMPDIWQDEVADIWRVLCRWGVDDPPSWRVLWWQDGCQGPDGGKDVPGKWLSVKRLHRDYTNYRHHRFKRREVRDLEQFQFDARQWSARTFRGQTEQSMIDHLRDEVNNELAVGCDPEELADIGLILLALAGRRGISLGQVMHWKHEVCRTRQWVQDGGEGFPKHVKGDDGVATL